MKSLKEMIETMAYDESKKRQFAIYVGEKVREERMKRNLTTGDLANLTGKSESGIYKVEHGTTKISFETLVCICLAMSIRIEALVPECFGFEKKENSIFDGGSKR